jgi:hypothetical protein
VTDQTTRHGKMVEHMRRHTELRRRAAEQAVRDAIGQDEPGQEDGDGETGG